MDSIGTVGVLILYIPTFIGLLEPAKWFKQPEFGKLGVIDQMKESAIILIGIVAGYTILLLDPRSSNVAIRHLFTSIHICFSVLGNKLPSPQTLRAEEILERLAEKMGEKLGESMAKDIKAKES